MEFIHGSFDEEECVKEDTELKENIQRRVNKLGGIFLYNETYHRHMDTK